ncbi:hypothetical protein SAMN05216581_5423 [Pseudomonas asplenii]|uniref:Uncharacterized protein n=1 Tax=Pseudomonas asplenii TaxID=53407 RepID=A0A1H6P3Z7_9PSED|nr:hypothetical protein SAMN05216581_5423 [Pseudomonas fuscovaginae]
MAVNPGAALAWQAAPNGFLGSAYPNAGKPVRHLEQLLIRRKVLRLLACGLKNA